MLSPAESVAAAYCWLTRWSEPRPSQMAATFERVQSFWHPGRCRFCDTPLPTLIDLIDESKDRMLKEPDDAQQRAWASFKALGKNARLARIREAQETPWYEDVVNPAGLTPEPPTPTMPR